jgi:heme-degrading monooxygenase HmoA
MAVKLINVFIVPHEKENEFLANWRKTAEFFSRKKGFIETHLHRNAGTGNTTFSFINIALWESPEAWQSNHDEYKPTEYSIPGVKGHPSIFEPIVDLYYQGS